MSNQVGVNDVRQIDTDSKLVSVLSLRPLSYSLRVHQDQPPPSLCLWTFVVGPGLRVRPAVFIRDTPTKVWPCKGRALYSNGTGLECTEKNVPPKNQQLSFFQSPSRPLE